MTGTLTVTNQPTTTVTLTVSPSSTSTYGQDVTSTAAVTPTASGNPTPTGTVQFQLDGSAFGPAVTLVNGSATIDLLTGLQVGTHTITATYSGDTNYVSTSQWSTQTVTPAPVDDHHTQHHQVYGAALPTLTASYSGFVNGDTSASLTSQPVLSTTATTDSHVSAGPYPIIASGAADSNYTISYVSGHVTVTPVALTITADNQNKVYGAAMPTLTASYAGLVNGDTAATFSQAPNTAPNIVSTATASSHVSGSPYAITASGAADTDYSISYSSGNLTVTTAALTITANNQSKVYGAALPTLTASYTGFVNGDTSASLTTQPTLSTTATSSSHVSGNPYSITASGAADSDYSISYASGRLTVTTAALTITANNQSKVYGAALPTLTASYAGLVNGDTAASLTTQPSLATTATASSHVSGNPYAITASGAADSDYTISYVVGALTVTPAALTITANNQSKVYGAVLPTLTVGYSGLVNGDTAASLTILPTVTTTATTGSHVSGSSYAITASGAVDTDYSYQLRRRHAHCHSGGVDHHRQEQDQGLRCSLCPRSPCPTPASSMATPRPA